MSRGLEDAAQSGPKREFGVIKQQLCDYRLIGAGVRWTGWMELGQINCSIEPELKLRTRGPNLHLRTLF